MKRSHTLPIIVLSQFCCTSLWFAGNAIMPALTEAFGLPASALGHLTSAVQLGFILGTLSFAVLAIADRFSPSKVFFVCSVLGSAVNLASVIDENQFISLITIRFATGFFLAGIYPVGMKIAADHFQKGLGTSLGFLVGALVLGTAFPHSLAAFSLDIPWQIIIVSTSSLSLIGGLLILFLVPDGTYRHPSEKVKIKAIFTVFKIPSFRSAATGYFGHMWELYTFWAFVPFLLMLFQQTHTEAQFNISLLSFITIAVGAPACVAAGFLSRRFGTKPIAAAALLISGICCVLSPLLILQDSTLLFLAFILIWGMVVIADSPLFSTLVAQHAPAKQKGSALTIVNSLGFALTIVSIQLTNYLIDSWNPYYVFLILAIGPLFGLVGLWTRNPKKISVSTF
ncbi:MAG: MFS transporter [Cyclobacteriaceae bacterium]